jgi:hypothetical protein
MCYFSSRVLPYLAKFIPLLFAEDTEFLFQTQTRAILLKNTIKFCFVFV